jgi:hypothetical protein
MGTLLLGVWSGLPRVPSTQRVEPCRPPETPLDVVTHRSAQSGPLPALLSARLYPAHLLPHKPGDHLFEL